MESNQALATYKVNTNLNDASLIAASFPQFDDPRKTDFLVMRTCMSVAEARHLVGISTNEYNEWRNSDPAFYEWDVNHLWKIRGSIASVVLKARFMRNVFLTMNLDAELLAKSTFTPEDLNKDERDEAKEAKKRYGPAGIATMLKALDGAEEDSTGTQHIKMELDIKIDDGDVAAYSVKKATARALLEWANRDSEHPNAIDAESKVIS